LEASGRPAPAGTDRAADPLGSRGQARVIQDLIFGVVGGLGLFIFGIQFMSEALHKAAGERMRRILQHLTGSPIRGLLVGGGITAVIQSSSATTVMVVGFVNAGLMTLRQALGVIFGANIGTTVTGQLIAFRLTDYALPIIGLSTLLMLVARRKVWKNIGAVLLGFGILFLGLHILTSVVRDTADQNQFRDLFLNFSHSPLLGIGAGFIVTVILQSSSVTTGMVIGLAMAGLLDLRGAIPLVLGCDIGTCVTAMLASVGSNVTARRAALGHVLFNAFGVALCLLVLPWFIALVEHTSPDVPRQIANGNTLFKIANTCLFLPFIPLFARFLTRVLPGREEERLESMPQYLDPHLISTPPIAIDAAIKEIIRTLELTRRMVSLSMEGLLQNDRSNLERVTRMEEAVDSLRTAITGYLVELMQRELSPEDSRKIPPLIHAINDVERIGDHAENLRDLAEQKIDRGMLFTESAQAELREMYDDVNRMIELAVRALAANSVEEAGHVLEQEDRVNALRKQLKSNHVRRLDQGECNVLSGVVFFDTIQNLEKIGDHLANVAQAVVGGLQ
jgi:phosphate:Na+ symporter